MLPPPTFPHSPPCSLAMKTLPHLLLLLLLLPQIRGSRTSQVKTTGKAGEWPSSKNTLVAANQGEANPDVKKILKQILRSIRQHGFKNKSGLGLTSRVKGGFWKLFSEKDKQRKQSQKKYRPWKLERIM